MSRRFSAGRFVHELCEHVAYDRLVLRLAGEVPEFPRIAVAIEEHGFPQTDLPRTGHHLL
jgi:hypothetical protein